MKSSIYVSQSPSKEVAKSILVSLSKNTKRMSWRVPTLDAPGARLPPSDCRNVRSRFAPPGTNGTMMVNSERFPRRAPTRPALSIGGGGSETCDLSSLSTFSRAVFPGSVASANSSRNCCIFCSGLPSCFAFVAVCVCVGIVVFSFESVVDICLAIQLGGRHLLPEHFCQVLRLLTLLVVLLVAQDRGLPVDLLARAHDAAEWTVLLSDAPGGHRRPVHLFEIVFPADILLRQAQFCDGHVRRKTLWPNHRRFLNRHLCQIHTQLYLDIELIGTFAQLRYQRRPKDLWGGSRIESSTRNPVGERLHRCDTNLCDVVAMSYRAHGPIRREEQVNELFLRELQESSEFLPCPFF